MASSSGNSGEDLGQVMDQRKRKRMLSNRESARRSRMRKQKHLDDLMVQADELRNQNNQILTNLNVTTQHYVNVEAENSVLRAQMIELTQRLDSLNEILDYINSSTVAGGGVGGWGSCVYEAEEEFQHHGFGDTLLNVNPWNLVGINQNPIVASAEMFNY